MRCPIFHWKKNPIRAAFQCGSKSTTTMSHSPTCFDAIIYSSEDSNKKDIGTLSHVKTARMQEELKDRTEIILDVTVNSVGSRIEVRCTTWYSSGDMKLWYLVQEKDPRTVTQHPSSVNSGSELTIADRYLFNVCGLRQGRSPHSVEGPLGAL